MCATQKTTTYLRNCLSCICALKASSSSLRTRAADCFACSCRSLCFAIYSDTSSCTCRVSSCLLSCVLLLLLLEPPAVL